MDIFKSPIASFSASKPTELGTKPGPCKTVDRFMLPLPAPSNASFPPFGCRCPQAVTCSKGPKAPYQGKQSKMEDTSKWGRCQELHTHFLILTKALHLKLRKQVRPPSNHSKGAKWHWVQVELIPSLPTSPTPPPANCTRNIHNPPY